MTPLEAAILPFEKNLTVSGVKKSNVIEVSFQHEDPQVAARVVNLLVELFQGKHLQVFSDPQSSFLEKQLAEYRTEAQESESRMEAFKQKNRVFSLDEQRSLLLKQRTELDTSLKNTKNQVDELQKKLSSLKSQKKARTQDKTMYTLSERDKIIVDAKVPAPLPPAQGTGPPEAVPGGQPPRREHPQGDPDRQGIPEGAGNGNQRQGANGEPGLPGSGKGDDQDPGGIELPDRQGGGPDEAVGNPGERDPVVRPAGQRVPDAEAGSGLQREEFPHLPGAARGGPHLGGHEPEENGQHQRDPGGGRPREADQAEKGIEHPAGDDPRRRFGPRVRLLLRIHVGEFFHPGNRRETAGAARAHDDLPQGLNRAMYLDFYHLNREPFRITPDPEFLYLSPSHKEALASIAYGVEQRKGIIAVTGEVGTGKTTILRSYLDKADPERLKAVYVFNPNVSFPALLQTIFRELGIPSGSGEASGMVDRFHRYLIEEYKKDNTVVLFIDEAQNMPVETLENLRMLSNLESSADKLLQIVLCGQPELEQLLGRNELRQLKSRIAVRADISPLSRKESLEYIRHRLSMSSRKESDIFTRAALERIVRKAKGNPEVDQHPLRQRADHRLRIRGKKSDLSNRRGDHRGPGGEVPLGNSGMGPRFDRSFPFPGRRILDLFDGTPPPLRTPPTTPSSSGSNPKMEE